MAVQTTDHDGVITVTGTTATAQSIFTDRKKIQCIYWYRPTTAGHMLHLITNSDKDFVRFYCDNADCSQNLILNGFDVQGLKVDDMDSGTLKIFYLK